MAVTQSPAAAHKSTALEAAASLSPKTAKSTSASTTDTSSSSGASSRSNSNSSAKDKAGDEDEDEVKPAAKEPTHEDTKKELARKTSKARSEGGRSNSRRSSLGVDRSSRPHYKEGIRLAEMGKWTTLMERVASEPQLARHKDHHGMLPLHWACTEDDVPTSAVRALLAAFPEAVITKNNAQYLPLHIAVKARASLATLRLLVEARPSSLLEETPSGKTVLQLATELQLPAGSMQLLQRAEQDYHDLSEDDDEAFDYEDAKRQIAVQSQLLRESMLPPPSMAGPNASLGNGISAPITDADDEDEDEDGHYGDAATSDKMLESQGMITSLSFVHGALVQSQSISTNAAAPQKDGDANSTSVPGGKDQRKNSDQAPLRSKSHKETSAKSTNAPVELQNEATPPATGPGRSKSQSKSRSKSSSKTTTGPALRTTGLDESTFGQAIYEEQHNAGVCGVCYKKFSMFRKKYQCKGCFTYLCKKHVAGKLELPNYNKKSVVCGDCYRIYRNGPIPGGPASTTMSDRRARNSTSMSTTTTTNGAGGNAMTNLSASPSLPLPPPLSSAASSKADTLDSTLLNSSSLMVSGNSRSSSLTGNNMIGGRPKRAESTHSMMGRPSNVQGPQLNARYSTNALGAPHPIRTQAGALVRGVSSNTMMSDTTVSISDPENERHAAEVGALQHRVTTLEECNKVLMNRVADQEKQYNEAMLLLTTTMTRVAEMEIGMPTSGQRKSLRGTGGSTTASERASELDTDMSKFSFPTPYLEKYD